MPHLKCEPCRIWIHSDDRRLRDVGDERCPSCNAPLEPAAGLTELVGLQRSRFDGLPPADHNDFLTAVAMALTPPGTER